MNIRIIRGIRIRIRIIRIMFMKKVAAIVKLHIPAGKATPAPPIGPALSRHASLRSSNTAPQKPSVSGGRSLRSLPVFLYGGEFFSPDPPLQSRPY